MRKILSLLAMMALAGCGGGGGANTAPNPISPPITNPPANLVTPQFTIVIPPAGTTSGKVRKPNFVSSATKSVTITLVTVGGNPPTVTPTSVTTNIDNSGGACNAGCVVNGPPSPPGQADAYTIVTYDGLNGASGNNALDSGAVTFTPTAGTNNVQNVTLNGIPFSVVISALTAQAVDSAGQTQTVTVTVKDHAGQTITGTYANSVLITDPDPATYGASIKGTSLSGTHTGACVTSCVTMQTSTDTATLTYNGLAEDSVTLTSTTTGVTGGNAGTATFTPTLSPITHTSGGNSQAAGNPVGIDLYTTDNTSPVGYSGTEGYHEPGYTDAPYNKVLTTINGTTCAAFATLGAANAANDTVFTATAIASPAAGTCTRVVSDGLAAANHGTGGPQFVVTYTTSQVNASSKHRHQ